MTVNDPSAYTTQAVGDVFAKVIASLGGALRKKGYDEAQITHVAALCEHVRGHEQWQGVPADAIHAGIERYIRKKATDANGIVTVKPDLLTLTADDIVKSIPNLVGSGKVKPEVREAVVTALRERAKAEPHKPEVKKISQFGTQDKLMIGLGALAAGMSLYAGISNLIAAREAAKAEGDMKVDVPVSTYVLAAAQILLGAGMAAYAHNQFQNPMGSAARA